MNVTEIKAVILFETNNDQEDAAEFEPFLLDYINEGYDRLVFAHAKKHVEAGGEYPPLQLGGDEPNLPAWTHMAIANWAAWCMFRNGNPGKQNRGLAYRGAAEETTARILGGTAANHFVNTPR